MAEPKAEPTSTIAVKEDELKRRTGEFDLEAIAFLDLCDQGLSELGAVPLCTSLRMLNLSCNQLVDVRALVSLVTLEELDLSANNISSLENFDKLEKLQRLDLPGNCLTQLESLLPLCHLPHLRSLCLQILGTTLTNPLCQSEGYTVFMSQSFPHLSWLDGERVEEVGEGSLKEGGVRKERGELERQLKRLVAVGNEPEYEDEEKEAAKNKGTSEDMDPLLGFSLNDQQAMRKISRLLLESRENSQRMQDHINTLQKELLH